MSTLLLDSSEMLEFLVNKHSIKCGVFINILPQVDGVISILGFFFLVVSNHK